MQNSLFNFLLKQVNIKLPSETRKLSSFLDLNEYAVTKPRLYPRKINISAFTRLSDNSTI